LTLLHRPVDEFAPKELVLHGRMEVGVESVALPLVALLVAVLSILNDALPRTVNFGSISQVDGTDPIFFVIVLIITEVDLNLIEWRSLSFKSFCWTFAMFKRLLIFLPLEHGPILNIENTRRSSPFGPPHMRCLPFLRWHHALTRCLMATLHLESRFLFGGNPTRKATNGTRPMDANIE